MVGAIPKAYGWSGGPVNLETYFAMARGSVGGASHPICVHGHSAPAHGVPALEMTKWFDTNYHYMVPELEPDQDFTLASTKPVDEFREALAIGYKTRPVILGPISFLKLSKCTDGTTECINLIDKILSVYLDLMEQLQAAGAEWLQIDEPALVLDLSEIERAAYKRVYSKIAKTVPSLKIMLTSYFGSLGNNLDIATSLPVAGLHIDLVRAPEQLTAVRQKLQQNQILSLGVIDGRNIWRADLQKLHDWLLPVVQERGLTGIELAPSCSLLHTPIDLELETELDSDLKSWLAFSVQKMAELSTLGQAFEKGVETVAGALQAATKALQARATSDKVHNKTVQNRVQATGSELTSRNSPFKTRSFLQQEATGLPLFPTTTIGSFPQTAEVRKARTAFNKGELSPTAYNAFLKTETKRAIRWQEEIGIDVLVHGEFERNDMVQYFGEQLAGYAFTKHAWVQSYGSRCVRPPIIYGDVARPHAMTVEWTAYAQSLTSRPVKGMLTGPVTMLQWSFVRDDMPRADVCKQIALALRDEVTDLETAGIRLIQVDEPALREGLPLRRLEWSAYLEWAVACFKLATSGVTDAVQIHTHMCYCEFNDIISSIAAMDADVISIETSRSKMELLDAFVSYSYPNDIGPGVYDIHSPRIPKTAEISNLLEKANGLLKATQIWVNPDCGLKTRSWDEVRPALIAMVAAAKNLRQHAESRNT